MERAGGRRGLAAVAGLLVALCLAGLGALLVAGEAGANWEGSERQHGRAQCERMTQSCGGFCLYARCLRCSDCQCNCCTATRTNDGCYCTVPCPCWLDGDGNTVCDTPRLHRFSDCGPACVRWAWRLYAGADQPGRGDGEVENPFHVSGLGTALFVRTQPYDGTLCKEEGVSGQQRPLTSAYGGVPVIDDAQAYMGDDLVMERPGEGFPEEDFEPEAGAVVVSVAPVAGREGLFDVSLSGGGGALMWRHWDAGAGVPASRNVPFAPWSGGGAVELPRGWRAVQGAHADGEGNPAGLSRVAVVWSGGAVEVSAQREPGSPEPTPLPVIEGVARPERPSLGMGFTLASRRGEVLFNVSAVPAGMEARYRVWEATGTGPVEERAEWVRFIPAGGLLSLANRGVAASGAGYMAVQTQLRREVPDIGWVEGPSSVIRYYWVVPDGGGWVPDRHVIGEEDWVEGLDSLFGSPEMTPVPVPEAGSLPSAPRLLGLRRLSTSYGYVRVGVSGVESGTVMQYRLWQSTGRAPGAPPVNEEGTPVRDERLWHDAAVIAGDGGREVVVWVGERSRGALGQWMSLQLRQMRRAGDAEVAGNGSRVLEFRIDALEDP